MSPEEWYAKGVQAAQQRAIVPTDAAVRKSLPIVRGVLDYFPDALLEIAEVSAGGSQQHHPSEPMHWDKAKSPDHADSCVRHLIDRGKRDIDGRRHSAKAAWRALANLQIEIEEERRANSSSAT